MRRLRFFFSVDPDAGYRWWTCCWGWRGEDPAVYPGAYRWWTAKLGPLTACWSPVAGWETFLLGRWALYRSAKSRAILRGTSCPP